MNGLLVKEWLKKQGMKPEELAVKMMVSFSTVAKILRGHKPATHTITVLAGLMGVSREKLLSTDKEIPLKRRKEPSARSLT